MIPKIVGAQRDFSFGEVDVALKRSDDHPARKAGLRQMANARILNSGSIQDRPGRRALYPVTNGGTRTERFTISAGLNFDIQFAPNRLKIIDATGNVVGNFIAQGNNDASPLPWVTVDDINSIVYAVFGSSIYVTFGHSMAPQVITFDGVSTWSILQYAELGLGGQKRTPFYRISPQGITLLPGARTGAGVSIVASDPIFTAAHVGTRLRFINRQMLITAVTNALNATVTITEALPGHQNLGVGTDPQPIFSIGDIIIGQTSGSKGIVTAISGAGIDVQLITTNSTTVFVQNGFQVENRTVAFQTNE